MKKKMMACLLALCLVVGVSACGKGCSKNKYEVTVDGAPVLTMFINQGDQFDGVKKDSIWKQIEIEANVNMRIQGSTHGSDYYDTLNPKMLAGDKIDIVFTVPADAGDAYNDWVEQNVIWNLDELLAAKPGAYPNIEKVLRSEQYRNIQYGEGKHTLLPNISSSSGWGIYYRTDWLKKVGFTDAAGNARTPDTIEEFQTVLKLFTENDPDGNGKNDTWGLSPGPEPFYCNPLYHAFGVTPDYDLDENDEATYMYLTDEYRQFLTWFQDMYNMGYIDPQFNANNNNNDREKFYNGKVGILITNAEQHVTWVAKTFEDANGANKLMFGLPPAGTTNVGKAGARGFSDWGGWWGGFSITKRCNDPHAAMRLLDYLYSPEGTMLRNYGIEGTHYTATDGNITPLLDGRNAEPEERFNTSLDTATGAMQPTGFYRLGNNLGSCIDWSHFETDGKLGLKLDSKSLDAKYFALIDEGVAKNVTVGSRLLNMTATYPGYATKMKKINDACATYALQAMMNKIAVDDGYTALVAQIAQSSYDWAGVQKMLKAVARDSGIL